MSDYVDWPIETQDPVGLAVLLPGQNYPATMPLLTFAGRAVLELSFRTLVDQYLANYEDADFVAA